MPLVAKIRDARILIGRARLISRSKLSGGEGMTCKHF